MALVDCPECAHRVSDRASACTKCGHPIAAHLCPECGTISSVVESCSNCGCPLKSGVGSAAVASPLAQGASASRPSTNDEKRSDPIIVPEEGTGALRPEKTDAEYDGRVFDSYGVKIRDGLLSYALNGVSIPMAQVVGTRVVMSRRSSTLLTVSAFSLVIVVVFTGVGIWGLRQVDVSVGAARDAANQVVLASFIGAGALLVASAIGLVYGGKARYSVMVSPRDRREVLLIESHDEWRMKRVCDAVRKAMSPS